MPNEEPSVVVTSRAGTGDVTVTVTELPWYTMIAIRVARTYIQGVIGFLGVGVSGALGATSFAQVLLHAASLALAPAVVSLLQNSVELLAKLDATHPSLRA